jgi:hypothetical protein
MSFMLSVANKPFLLSVVMLNVIILSDIMLSAIVPNVVAPNRHLTHDLYFPFQKIHLSIIVGQVL